MSFYEKDHFPDILNCLANLSSDEVFTPPNIANKMLDLLPQELFTNPNSKFLDPFSKSGVFLREIAKRLLKGLETQIPNLQERIDHIMHRQLYGIGITELTALMSRRTLYCSARANGKHSVAKFPDEGGNIFFEEIPHIWDNAGKCTYCGANKKDFGDEVRDGLSKHAYPFIHNKNPYKHMNFDVIIGNPPYQMSDGGAQASAKPIYHKFIQQAKQLNPKYLCIIVPSRWFAGGKGLDEFRNEMLSDRRLKEIHDHPNASDVFPGVEIKGGVNYFLWQNGYEGDCLIKTYNDGQCISEMTRPLKEEGAEILIRDNQAISIYHKVRNFKEKSFSEIVSSRKPFGLPTNFKGKKEPFKDAVKIYVNGGIGYVKREDIPLVKNTSEPRDKAPLLIENKLIDVHKIIVPYAVGSGNSQEDLVKPIYAEPNTCCSETYLVIGPFADKEQCENVMSYIKTKFFHFMLGLKKITQHTVKDTYQFVPQQDFSKPWTDEELYKKYKLTEEEITYIEIMVRPME